MFPAEQYNNIYTHAILALTVLTAILYARGFAGYVQSESYSASMSVIVCGLMAIFLGTRPISGVFIDMTTYDMSYRMTSMTGESTFPEWAFSRMVTAFSSYFDSDVFFLACACIYTLPLLWLRRAHGNWALAIVVAHLGAFSFFSYGVNVIRHGMAASLLIAAICNRDRKWLMAGLMAIAYGMHKSILAPIVAFLAASLFNASVAMWACWLAWFGALAVSLSTRGVISDRIMNLSIFSSDERFAKYLGGLGNDKGGFRWDFILYSIVPVIITFSLAGTSVRKDPLYRALVMTFLLTNAFWLLVIYAAYSDRFAYLSWFLLPWLIVYPFTPAKSRDGMGAEPTSLRLGWLAAALLAHFAFTYFMQMVYYRGVVQ